MQLPIQAASKQGGWEEIPHSHKEDASTPAQAASAPSPSTIMGRCATLVVHRKTCATRWVWCTIGSTEALHLYSVHIPLILHSYSINH